MRLASFEVQGFKNLVEPVRLEGLEAINVLHGANNVGKSNLLQAMGLFFVLVGVGPSMRKEYTLTDEDLLRRGLIRSELFNLEMSSPIRLDARIETTADELARAGLQADTHPGRLRAELELRWMGKYATYTTSCIGLEQRDFGVTGPTKDEEAALPQLCYVLAKNLRVVGEPVDRFARIPVERLDTAALALALYDAKESPEIAVSRTWDRFVEMMSTFEDILGEGKFVAIYDRKAQRANLLYQTARARIPLQLLGSGVQQIVALFGRILTCGASIVAVEEPELNLRWSLQERVRDALRELVGKEGAPSQIFLTSHSGAFESGEKFYLMQRDAGGHPTVARAPLRDLPLVLGGVVPETPVAGPRAPAYVSSEGTLRLPDRIRKAIGVEHGGGVSFVDKGEGVAEVMSDDTLLRLAGLDDDT